MKDEIILKLIRSSSIDDVKIGLNFLLEKYPDNTDIIDFFHKFGKPQEEDVQCWISHVIEDTNLKDWHLFESSRNMLFAVKHRVWLYKSDLEGSWNYKNTHFKIHVL